MADRITLNGLYKQFVDFRGEFNLLAQNYAEHMKQEQPWMEKVDSALFGVDGDEDKPGLHRDVAEIKGYIKSGWSTFKWTARAVLGAVVVVIITSVAGCIQREAELSNLPAPQQTAIALNATYTAGTATTNTVFVPTPEYDPSQTPTASATPEIVVRATPTATASPTSSIAEVTPCGQAICVLPDQDEDVLARLCVAEVRGFGDKRRMACLSVISTVLTRMVTRQYSDGTVEGTIKWHCGPETKECAFPAYVVDGCAGILPAACPWNYPDDIAYFQGVARDALNGDWGTESGVCRGALYYDSRETSLKLPGACVIRADNNQFEVFHAE